LLQILKAGMKNYHPECFCCSCCNCCLDGTPFHVHAEQGPHCLKCFHEWASSCLQQKSNTFYNLQEICASMCSMPKSDHPRAGQEWNTENRVDEPQLSRGLLPMRGRCFSVIFECLHQKINVVVNRRIVAWLCRRGSKATNVTRWKTRFCAKIAMQVGWRPSSAQGNPNKIFIPHTSVLWLYLTAIL